MINCLILLSTVTPDTYLQHIIEVRDVVTKTATRRYEIEAHRYSKGIKRVVHNIRDMVMLFQKEVGKLQPRYLTSSLPGFLHETP